LRQLSDDTLLVFVSDSHIGGDGGRDIFESPDELKALFDELAAHAGPVELVLAGDFFDFLRITERPARSNPASLTIERRECRELFEALRRSAIASGSVTAKWRSPATRAATSVEACTPTPRLRPLPPPAQLSGAIPVP
jgi:hypothetical protein